MSFSPQNENGCFKNKKKNKSEETVDIYQYIPQQDHTDLHCIDILISTAFHTMGTDILFHTELQFDQPHMLNIKVLIHSFTSLVRSLNIRCKILI